jgi:hypothetical protein
VGEARCRVVQSPTAGVARIALNGEAPAREVSYGAERQETGHYLPARSQPNKAKRTVIKTVVGLDL